MKAWHCFLLALIPWVVLHPMPVLAQAKLKIDFVDDETSKPIAGRIELQQTKKVFKPKGALSVGKLILAEGETQWSPPLGTHFFKLERGPEYDVLDGEFTIEKFAEDSKQVRLKHRTPLRQEGWHSGDLLSTLPTDVLQRWQRGEDLDVTVSTSDAKAATLSPKNIDGKVWTESTSLLTTDASSYWDRRAGSGLVFHHCEQAVVPNADEPSSKLLVDAKKQPSTIAEIQSLWARDVPIWLASGRIDLAQVFSQHLLPSELSSVTHFRNPDSNRFQGKKGLGRLVEHIYWQMLEAGFRIAPSAGSGFGDPKLPTHLGYNRVYVHLDPPATSEDWWKQLVQGRSFVTNGPLLRSRIFGNYPGEIFRATAGQSLDLVIDLQLSVRDRVEYLDVIHNSQTIYQARLEDHAARGDFPPLKIDRSGWLVIRVVTEHEASYRLAMSSPYYFEFDGQPRISRKAVRFFQEWLDESAQEIEKLPNASAHQPYVDAARRFWSKRLEQASDD